MNIISSKSINKVYCDNDDCEKDKRYCDDLNGTITTYIRIGTIYYIIENLGYDINLCKLCFDELFNKIKFEKFKAFK